MIRRIIVRIFNVLEGKIFLNLSLVWKVQSTFDFSHLSKIKFNFVLRYQLQSLHPFVCSLLYNSERLML